MIVWGRLSQAQLLHRVAIEAGCFFALGVSAARTKVLWQNFDRYVSSEFRIAGSINLAHATRTNSLDDFVLTELGARGEGHG